jgi:hypothetical protein
MDLDLALVECRSLDGVIPAIQAGVVKLLLHDNTRIDQRFAKEILLARCLYRSKIVTIARE